VITLDIGSLLVDAAAFAVLAFVLGAIGLTALATMMVVRLRRRWRSLRESARARLHGSGLLADARKVDRGTVTAAAMASGSRFTSPHWWATQQARRRMWRGVSAASHAVKVARASGAPVGDLPTVLRQLEAAARSADALARADADVPGNGRSGVLETRRIEEAALHLQQAALQSLQSVAAVEVEPLLPAVRLEAAALAAGVRAAAIARRPV